MTGPTPANINEEALRRRWLTPFTTVQKRYEKRIRNVFNIAAEDAYQQVNALSTNSTFSAAVRTAQLRIVLSELQPIVKEAFDDTLSITRDGQQDAAVLAVTALGQTDRDYLAAAFSNSGDVRDFIAGERQAARLNVISAISSITKSNYKLSPIVYGSNALAKGWLKNQTTALILRGTSAKEIARAVRSSVRGDVPGGVSYAALRLGRTELNNAFHATAISVAKDRPWITGMDWHLSSVHQHRDIAGQPEICEQYSAQQWTLRNVPPKPHPQCRCFVTPTLVPYEEFLRDLTAGKYRSWIDEAA